MNPELDSATIPVPAPAVADPGRRARLTVFLVVFIDLLGFGIVLPQLPLISSDFLDPLLPGTDTLHGGETPLGGLIIGALYASFSLMQFLLAPAWGRLSDRIGRRPVLLLGLIGSVVFYALFGVGSELGALGAPLVGLILLFVARTGAGVAGATIAIAQAVIADSTPSEQRARGMALIGAAFGIGFTFGPALGALMLWLVPHFRGGPGFLASAMSLTALLVCYRQLPETLQPGRSRSAVDRAPFARLGEVLRSPDIGLLVFSFFLATFAFANFETTLALLNKALGFSDRANSMVFTAVGLTLALSAGLLVRRLAGRIPTLTMLTIGLTGMVVGIAGFAAVANYRVGPDDAGRTLLLYGFGLSLVVCVTGFSFLNPSVQTLISQRSDPARQGEFLGVNQSASALARVAGPAVGPFLFNLTKSHMLPYVVASGLMIVVLSLLPRVRKG